MRMSLRTLRKNLDKLESAGIIIREVDTSKRPPGVYYHRYKHGIMFAVEDPESGRARREAVNGKEFGYSLSGN